MKTQTGNKISGISDSIIIKIWNFLNEHNGAISVIAMVIVGAISVIGDFAIMNYRMKRTPDKVEQHDEKILALHENILDVKTNIIDLRDNNQKMMTQFDNIQSNVRSMQSSVSNMQSNVSNVQSQLEKMQLRLDIFSDDLVTSDKLGEKHSPIRLNEAGKQVYKVIKGEQFLQQNMVLLMHNIESINPRTPIDVQISAKDVIIDLLKDPIFDDIKAIVYNSPEIEINKNGIKRNYQISILDACFVLSIPLRDMYLDANPEIVKNAQTK